MQARLEARPNPLALLSMPASHPGGEGGCEDRVTRGEIAHLLLAPEAKPGLAADHHPEHQMADQPFCGGMEVNFLSGLQVRPN